MVVASVTSSSCCQLHRRTLSAFLFQKLAFPFNPRFDAFNFLFYHRSICVIVDSHGFEFVSVQIEKLWTIHLQM